MRDLFTRWSWSCCPADPRVTKLMANMTFRSLIPRYNNATGMKSFFKFDFEFNHLAERIPEVPGRVDVVVISMGLYEARSTPLNISMKDLNDTVRVVIKSVCEVHGARVGFYLAGGLECKTMKRSMKSERRQAGRFCPASSKMWRMMNVAIYNMLEDQPPPETSPCYIHYIPNLKCSGEGKKMCTVDGIHPRPNFAKTRLSKMRLVLNALDAVVRL